MINGRFTSSRRVAIKKATRTNTNLPSGMNQTLIGRGTSSITASRSQQKQLIRTNGLLSQRNNHRFVALQQLVQQQQQQQQYYSTEKILELRTGRVGTESNPLPRTLYDPSNEKDNCGVGLIASLKSVPSRDIVEKADEMLVRMAHRGGCGCDPASGDGSGTFTIHNLYQNDKTNE